MGCGAAEATGLNFVCFVVINPRMQSTDLIWAFLFIYQFYPHPPEHYSIILSAMANNVEKLEAAEHAVKWGGG